MALVLFCTYWFIRRHKITTVLHFKAKYTWIISRSLPFSIIFVLRVNLPSLYFAGLCKSIDLLIITYVAYPSKFSRRFSLPVEDLLLYHLNWRRNLNLYRNSKGVKISIFLLLLFGAFFSLRQTRKTNVQKQLSIFIGIKF